MTTGSKTMKRDHIMSENESYTEEKLAADLQEQTKLFKNIFNGHIHSMRESILTDYRMPRPGWESPYKKIADLCDKMGKNSGPMNEALELAQSSMKALNELAESEMVDLQLKMGLVFESMDNVR